MTHSSKAMIPTRANLMQKLLENFEPKELLQWRFFSKKVANDVVPRIFKHLKCVCPDIEGETETNEFQLNMKYASTVEVHNINGGESILNNYLPKIVGITDRAYDLHLTFEQDDITTKIKHPKKIAK